MIFCLTKGLAYSLGLDTPLNDPHQERQLLDSLFTNWRICSTYRDKSVSVVEADGGPNATMYDVHEGSWNGVHYAVLVLGKWPKS